MILELELLSPQNVILTFNFQELQLQEEFHPFQLGKILLLFVKMKLFTLVSKQETAQPTVVLFGQSMEHQ